MDGNINWLSMLLATITPLAIGLVYYHQAAFGYLLRDNIQQMTLGRRFAAFALAALLSFFLAFFLLNFNNSGFDQEGDFDTFGHGAWHGFFVAITIMSPVIIIPSIFERKPWKQVLVHWVYWLITLVLMGGIVDAMNHWPNVPYPEG